VVVVRKYSNNKIKEKRLRGDEAGRNKKKGSARKEAGFSVEAKGSKKFSPLSIPIPVAVCLCLCLRFCLRFCLYHLKEGSAQGKRLQCGSRKKKRKGSAQGKEASRR
jgi:hypothetical protein